MRLTIAYSKIKKRNLVLINNVAHQRETLNRVTHSTTLNFRAADDWCLGNKAKK